MIYNFTGVQHLKTGDVTIPIVGFEEEEAFQARYHHEMEYALLDEDFIGLTIIVFNNRGEIVLNENWIRKVPTPEPIFEEPIIDDFENMEPDLVSPEER